MESIFANDTAFSEITPNTRILFTYAMETNGLGFSVLLASVELKPAGAGTRLVFTEQGAFIEGGDGANMREAGWSELLNKLARHLEN